MSTTTIPKAKAPSQFKKFVYCWIHGRKHVGDGDTPAVVWFFIFPVMYLTDNSGDEEIWHDSFYDIVRPLSK